MNRSRVGRIVVASVAALLASGPTAAQPRMPVDISPCAGIESALERLDCYDGLARAAARTADDAPAARGEAVPPTPLSRAAAPPPPPPAPLAGSAPAVADEITSQVVALREILPGRFEIELANGQLWRQTSSDRYRLQVGHEARLYRARDGDRFFRLTVAALRGFVQVERVR